MLSVYVCEDNLSFRKFLTQCIQNYIEGNDLDMELVMSTDDPKKVLNHIEEYNSKGLYFLDIELGGGRNGVLLANKIRHLDPRGFVVFITSYAQYLPLTFEYKVEALEYITKTEGDVKVLERVMSCMENAFQKHISRSDSGTLILLEQNGKHLSCTFDEIICLRTGSRGSNLVSVHTKKRVFMVRDSLSSISKKLPHGQFFQCHQSFIINTAAVPDSALIALNQGNNEFYMPDGTLCKVSFRNRHGFIKLLSSRRSHGGGL